MLEKFLIDNVEVVDKTMEDGEIIAVHFTGYDKETTEAVSFTVINTPFNSLLLNGNFHDRGAVNAPKTVLELVEYAFDETGDKVPHLNFIQMEFNYGRLNFHHFIPVSTILCDTMGLVDVFNRPVRK